MPASELKTLYIDRCFDRKFIYGTANYTMIVFRDGNIYSCGNNSLGQLGHGDNKQRLTFEKIKINKNKYNAI